MIKLVARILCVEDEPDLLDDLVCELREVAYEVIAVNNGLEALAALKASTFDLVLCDIQLSGMDGFGVLRKALTDLVIGVPFIFMTAYGDSEMQFRAIEAGAAGILVKPIDYDELIILVADLLGSGPIKLFGVPDPS